MKTIEYLYMDGDYYGFNFQFKNLLIRKDKSKYFGEIKDVYKDKKEYNNFKKICKNLNFFDFEYLDNFKIRIGLTKFVKYFIEIYLI